MTLKPEWRVVIVEDEALWQQGILTLLSLAPNIVCVGQFTDLDTAIETIQEDYTDIILLDWKFPGGRDGFELAHTLLKRAYKPEQIILITGSPQDQLPEHAFGYVSKPQIASQLLSTLESVIQKLA